MLTLGSLGWTGADIPRLNVGTGPSSACSPVLGKACENDAEWSTDTGRRTAKLRFTEGQTAVYRNRPGMNPATLDLGQGPVIAFPSLPDPTGRMLCGH
jgi:hypothetical protein